MYDLKEFMKRAGIRPSSFFLKCQQLDIYSPFVISYSILCCCNPFVENHPKILHHDADRPTHRQRIDRPLAYITSTKVGRSKMTTLGLVHSL